MEATMARAGCSVKPKKSRWRAAAAGLLLASGGALAAEPGATGYTLDVGMVRGQVFNPWTLGEDAVELRAYHGEAVRAGAFMGPTMSVRSGQVLRVRLNNRLPACTPDETQAGRCYNATNLHTHGLWVSPSGNSDNVLISVAPGALFDYEISLPDDHPAGTFWYHAHVHGATSAQLASGMAGALIVRGERAPTETAPGDVDILLRKNGRPLPERVLLFQQLQYACYDSDGRIKATLHNGLPIRPWRCAPGEIGRVEGFEGQPKSWPGSGRFTGVNGRVQPQLEAAAPGRFERWRLIHGGLREPVHLRVFRLNPAAPDLRTVPASQHRAWIGRYCTGEPLPLWRFAADGLTTRAVRQTDRAVLYPGNRIDLVTRFPAPGRYCLVDEKASWTTDPADRRMLALLPVGPGEAPATDAAAALQALMVRAAERALSGPIRRRVVDDLKNGMRLERFVWHQPVGEAELTGRQEATFNLVEPELPEGTLSINDKPFVHGRIDRRLPLGGVEEWRVTSQRGAHPFHIHVNPFEVIRVTDREGRDVTDPNSPAFDRDYEGLIGEWRDTLIVKNGHRAVVRTRYERYVGDFLVHCHFAGHGDRGMMQLVRIEPAGAQTVAAHDHAAAAAVGAQAQE
jgi:FtsP/CotA-like multicopper oxidase with cupredoxin domain